MKLGELNKAITISTSSETSTSGDVVVSWTTPVSARAKVTQVDGARFFKDDELIDRAVYKFELFDNSYGDNIRVTYNGLTLYPIRPITKNEGKTSFVDEIVIYCAVKK